MGISNHRRAGRIVLALAVPPLLLELLLQLGAVATPFLAARSDGDAGDAAQPGEGREPCAALCVGDSFTYGLGSSDPSRSWPMRLEAELEARPFRGRTRVVNAGWPGSTSREVLLAARQRLETLDPACVFVLVGVNDAWRKPELLQEEEVEQAAESTAGPGGGFRLEWRTRRLLQLLLQPPQENAAPAPFGDDAGGPLDDGPEGSALAGEADRDAGSAAGASPDGPRDPLVGAWRSAEGALTIRADGTASFAGVEYRWSRRGGGVDFVDVAPGGRTTHSRCILSARGVAFRPFPGTTAARRFARADDGARGAGARAGAGASGSALDRLDEEVARQPNDGRTRLRRLRMAQREDDEERVAEDLEFFRRKAAATNALEARRELATALAAAGFIEEAGRTAEEIVAADPGDASLWFLVAMAAQARGELEAALAAVDRSLAGDPTTDSGSPAERLRFRAKLHGKRGEPFEAARDTVAAWAIDQKDESLGREVMLAPRRYAAGQVEAVADSLHLETTKRERLRAVVAESLAGTDRAALEVMVEHVTRLVELCRARGIEVFLLNYPTTRPRAGPREQVTQTQQRIADETGVPLIDVRAHFRRLMADHDRTEFFVADGHCNDAGYAEMARVVAAALAEHEADEVPAAK